MDEIQTEPLPTENKVTSVVSLHLHHPRFEEDGAVEDTGVKGAYAELVHAKRAITNAVQAAVANVAKYLGELKGKGRARFATKAERDAVGEHEEELAVDCFRPSELKVISKMLYDSCKTSGLMSHVYSPTSQRLMLTQFSGTKLKDLVLGDAFAPWMRKVPLVIHNRNWRLETETVQKGDKVYQNLVVVLPPFIKGHRGLRLHCKRLHPPSSGRTAGFYDRKRVLDTIAAIPKGEVEAQGVHRGQLEIVTVKRPGMPPEWKLSVVYSKVVKIKEKTDTVMVVHRGVANMLTSLTVGSGENGRVGRAIMFPGTEVVEHKAQFLSRRRKISQSLNASPHVGKGRKHHYRALARVADAEARAVKAELQKAAKWVAIQAERNNVGLIVLDDFGPFSPDIQDKYLPPYVRNFPYAELSARITSTCSKQLGVTVLEESSAYISQRCPACGHTDRKNVTKLPEINGAVDSRDGTFQCQECGYTDYLDPVSTINMALASKHVPDLYKETVTRQMQRVAGYMKRVE